MNLFNRFYFRNGQGTSFWRFGSSASLDGDYHSLAHLRLVHISIPPKFRYRNGTHNDLMYWGLDYPPLTAFHEYVLGKIAEYLCPEVVTFEASRGCETSSCIVVHILCVFLLAIFSIVRAGYGYTGVSSVLLACDLFCFGLTEITFRFYFILPDDIFSCIAVNRSWPFSVQLGLSGSRSPFALLYRKRLRLHRLFPFCDGHRIQANSTLLFVGVFRVVVAQML